MTGFGHRRTQTGASLASAPFFDPRQRFDIVGMALFVDRSTAAGVSLLSRGAQRPSDDD